MKGGESCQNNSAQDEAGGNGNLEPVTDSNSTEEEVEDDMMTREDWDDMSQLQRDEYLNEMIDEFIWDDIEYRIERMAVVNNTQHVNVSVVEEDVNLTPEPHL